MSGLTFIEDIEGNREGGPINISSWDFDDPLTLVKKPSHLGSQFKMTIENFRSRDSMNEKFRPLTYRNGFGVLGVYRDRSRVLGVR